MQPIPVLLFGGDYWDRVINFNAIAEEGLIAPRDLDLFHRVETAEAGWARIVDFYALETGD
jgi:predicted Rossmann-fold nucleotide-binding protein